MSISKATFIHPGHYVFYYSNQSLLVSDQIIVFPSHQFVCGLSFSYFIIGPLDLEVIRENIGVDVVSMSQGRNEVEWENAHYQYNSSHFDYSSNRRSRLVIEVSEFDLGEAVIENEDVELFLALDNVTLTFCLPCDYNVLVEPGAIIVEGPERIDIQLRQVTHYQFSASASACPNETLIFNIESGMCLIMTVILASFS